MYILVSLYLSGVVQILGMTVVAPARRKMRAYSIVLAVFVLTGLILFTLFSWSLGLVRLGDPYNLNTPDDYLAQGAAGIAVLLLGIVGVLSPAFVAWLVKHYAEADGRRSKALSSSVRTQRSRGAMIETKQK